MKTREYRLDSYCRGSYSGTLISSLSLFAMRRSRTHRGSSTLETDGPTLGQINKNLLLKYLNALKLRDSYASTFLSLKAGKGLQIHHGKNRLAALAEWAGTMKSALGLLEAVGSPKVFPGAQLEKLALRSQKIAWDMLHTGKWDMISVHWREAYRASCCLLIVLYLGLGNFFEALAAADKALIMTGPSSNENFGLLVDFLVKKLGKADVAVPKRSAKRMRLSRQPAQTLTNCLSSTDDLFQFVSPLHDALNTGFLLRKQVPRVDKPSLEYFDREFFSRKHPCILGNLVSQWNAFQEWSIDFFKQNHGNRTVPIELGRDYRQKGWRQEFMTMKDFIEKFFESSSRSGGDVVGYLAHHQLFDQIPSLRADVLTPDYCVLDAAESEDPSYLPTPTANFWFGPRGTRSPLHHDPEDNILCQVLGTKLILLIDPCFSSRLAPLDGPQNNTSSVIFASPTFSQDHKCLKSLPCFTVVLRPGDALYIPKGWWHFCEAATASISVSFFWS